MVRIQLDLELDDVEDARGRLSDEGFVLNTASCVKRTRDHPRSEESLDVLHGYEPTGVCNLRVKRESFFSPGASERRN